MLASTALGGAQFKRVGEGRWTKAAERRFFDELGAPANVKRAAAAAGVSPAAVYARRLKRPLFRAQWAAVLDNGRAAIEMKLVEAANRTFDPDEFAGEFGAGEVEVRLGERSEGSSAAPRVSVAEAIRIVQLHGSKAQQESTRSMFEEQAAAMSKSDVDEIRAGLVRKLQRMQKRDRPEMIAKGWSYDEAYKHLVPPGWVRGAAVPAAVAAEVAGATGSGAAPAAVVEGYARWLDPGA